MGVGILFIMIAIIFFILSIIAFNSKEYKSKKNNIHKHFLTVQGKEHVFEIDASPKAIKRFDKNKNSANTTPIPSNCTRVDIDDFCRKYVSSIPEKLFDGLNERSMRGFDYADIPNETIEDIKEKREKYNEFNNRMAETAELNNKGIAYEKEGRIDKAIEVYEKNIKIGNPAHHSFKRLMILYRKDKDYENEHRIILRALDVFPDWTEYIDRLEKVEQLINNK